MESQKPKLWPAVVLAASFVPLSGILASLLLAGHHLLWKSGIEIGPENLLDGEELNEEGLLFVEIAMGLFWIGLLMLLAFRSREQLFDRLFLRVRGLSIWIIPVLIFGTFTAGATGGFLRAALFSEASEYKAELDTLIQSGVREHLFGFFVIVAVLPAIVEELLFRGYLQSRLLRTLPAGLAIVLSSLLFAAAHVEFQYAVAVFPIGIWLGLVAYWTGSIWPSVICHFVNNGFMVLMTHLSADQLEPESVPDASNSIGSLEALGGAVVAALVLCGLALFVRSRRNRAVLYEWRPSKGGKGSGLHEKH